MTGQSPHSYLEFLITNQNADGGWGYQPGIPSAVEATAWALAAIIAEPSVRKASERGRDWLIHAQRQDGSWPSFPGQRSGCWVTSVASRVLHLQGGAQSAVEHGVEWLLHAWPAEGNAWWRLRQTLFPSRLARQDSSLRGWSWTPGTASWVEPTAHSLLLLRCLPREMISPLAGKRRQLAERMLFDRMCPGGGWNSGNPVIYGVDGVPRIGPTVWALLATRQYAERPEIQVSLEWLASAYGGIRGAASLALAHRCLIAYGRRVPPLASALDELYRLDQFFDNMLTVAWICVALHEEASAAGERPREASGR